MSYTGYDVFLSWFFNRTRVGLRMTAVAEDHRVAMSLGISVQRSIAFAWLLGAMLSTMGAMVHLSGRSINMLSSDIGLGMAALPVALLVGWNRWPACCCSQGSSSASCRGSPPPIWTRSSAEPLVQCCHSSSCCWCC